MSREIIYPIKLEAIYRYPYKTMDDLVCAIIGEVKDGEGIVTISFAQKWWAKGIISPAMGKACNISIGYPKRFADTDIMELLIKGADLHFKTFEENDNVIIITNAYYEGRLFGFECMK